MFIWLPPFREMVIWLPPFRAMVIWLPPLNAMVIWLPLIFVQFYIMDILKSVVKKVQDWKKGITVHFLDCTHLCPLLSDIFCHGKREPLFTF